MELLFSQFTPEMILQLTAYAVGIVLAVLATYTLLGVRYIPNRAVGIVEKLWLPYGPVAEGRLIVLDRETGYRASVLRGGLYFLYWIWQYRIHTPLTIIPQGKIGYVFARDGEWVERLAGRRAEQTNLARRRGRSCRFAAENRLHRRLEVICPDDYRPAFVAQPAAAGAGTPVRHRRERRRRHARRRNGPFGHADRAVDGGEIGLRRCGENERPRTDGRFAGCGRKTEMRNGKGMLTARGKQTDHGKGVVC